MIELRWYSTTNYPTPKLQYRQQIDTTVYAGLGPFPESWKNMQWSDWTDVPEVKDTNPTKLSLVVNNGEK